MNFKFNNMKLNRENGITGIDVVVALGIIIVAITVISMIYVNVYIGNKSLDRTAGATRLVTNILENIEKLSYSEFINLLNNTDNNYNSGETKSISYIINHLPSGSESKIEEITNDDNEVIGKKYLIIGKEFGANKVFNTKIPSGFTIIFDVTNSFGTSNTNIKVNLVKNINITVKYKVGETDEEVVISTAKEKESIPVCNVPNLSNTYISEAGIFNKKIIPIKYSSSYNGYIKSTETDSDWYNYNSKEWARILVINSSKENLFFDENNRVKKEIYDGAQKLSVDDYIYVWIPNFSIENNFAYFRYNESKNKIEQVSKNLQNGKKIYYNTVTDVLTDYGNCNFNNMVGVWRKYNSNNDYYVAFNEETQYGPINEH